MSFGETINFSGNKFLEIKVLEKSKTEEVNYTNI